jgi:heme exporter protein CcmD
MNHAPFIWASYAISTVVLLWVAVAPLISKKSALKNIRAFNRTKDQLRDANS